LPPRNTDFEPILANRGYVMVVGCFCYDKSESISGTARIKM